MPAPLHPDHLAFALRLHQRLILSDAGMAWSPYSVASALGLLAMGARAATRLELTRLLTADADGEDALASHMAALDDAVTAGPEMARASGLWLRAGLPLASDTERRLRERPEASIHVADFAGDPEGARHAVNAEVAKVTRGLIGELLSPGAVTSATQALLTTAVWVRLAWRHPFTVDSTTPRPFATPAGQRHVPTMHRRGQMEYAATAGWRMVTLAGDHDLALDVLLPDSPTDSAPPQEATVRRLYRRSRVTEVELSLPRFEISHGSELVPALGDAGVTTLFSNDADLSGISPQRLRVDSVAHRCRLRVDEKGAEGAAATAVMMLAGAVPNRKPVVFTVDRPFHFLLRRHGAILFLGTVTEPHDPGPAS
ncbi:serpin family protein [Salinactinospora qingdaonensis]|uniref:Serpin family protein n=1 Tax=Salinactinospora qingdaonensis TaxID=702744 RepID=A0ABP7EYQ0_9ACTN